MTADAIIEALDLPPRSVVGSRIAKTLVAENSAASAADRRLIHEGIERLTWVAQVKPASSGLQASREADSLASEIAVVRLESRTAGARLDRLVEMIHRAVPYPVLLIVEAGQHTAISAARKRHSQVDADAVVLVAPPATAVIRSDAHLFEHLCQALTTASIRVHDLGDLYDRWAAVAVAVRGHAITGAFDLPDQSVVWDRWDRLREWERLGLEIERIEAQAKRATQMTDRVELNGRVQELRAEQRRLLELV